MKNKNQTKPQKDNSTTQPTGASSIVNERDGVSGWVPRRRKRPRSSTQLGRWIHHKNPPTITRCGRKTPDLFTNDQFLTPGKKQRAKLGPGATAELHWLLLFLWAVGKKEGRGKATD